jgi:hypothetical protein
MSETTTSQITKQTREELRKIGTMGVIIIRLLMT